MAFGSTIRGLWRDDSGSVFVEVAASLLAFILIVFGVTDFTIAFYKWNTASKATEFGARLAAVSSPVARALTTWNGTGLAASCYTDGAGNASTGLPGDYITPTSACSFKYVCTYNGGSGECNGDATSFSIGAMQRIVYGAEGRTVCSDNPTALDRGMCNIFLGLTADKVTVTYDYTGLGYVTRPGGAVPTITVGLRNIPYEFVFIGGFLPTSVITLPSFATTVTGEDLNVAWSG